MLNRLFFLLATLFLLTGSLQAQTGEENIRLNQIGFYPDAPKMAIIVEGSANTFYVTTPDLADTVFTGTLSSARTWSPSNETVQQADFTGLTSQGEFVVVVPNVGQSYPFRITERAHQEVARASIKGFYYQRMSIPLEQAYAGRWARRAGHPDTRVIVHASAASDARPAGTNISAPRGWYDAGDYNKYIVNSGITTGTLLMLFEHFPQYFSALDLNIPESGNTVPDLLDEILWNVRWMLAMQDPNDGGVYHKLTNANFDGMVMPHAATSPRYVVQKSTPAALDFAAVTAMAARIYDDYERAFPGLADSLITAARAAWDWAILNPNLAYRQNDINQTYNTKINTGEYGDGNFQDEFRWAAAELFLTTGESSFLQNHGPLQGPTSLSIPGWPDVGSMAFISLAHHRTATATAVDTSEVKRRLINRANQLLSDREQSPYDIVMGRSSGEFYWGSNAVAANQGMMLIQAYRLTEDERYLDAALSNLDYLLGRNATGYSFVTGYGDKTPMHPHHRPSEADGIADPVPGLLAGGPNPNREDQGGCPPYPSTLPAKAYLDHVCSYASNEIAINWNAPLAYLAGAIEAILSPTGTPVSIEDVPGSPAENQGGFSLNAYPNPVENSTKISFDLAKASSVSLVVYDLLGRRVASLVEEQYLSPGSHDFFFNVRTLSNGAYILHLHTPTTRTSKILFVER